jgi:malate dehydrogenase (oxaloacetate-decarboxylating)(NADP+)
LSARLDPSALLFQTITASVRANPKRVVFAEGEEEPVIRAAAAFQNSGLGDAILVGREEIVRERIQKLGIETDPPLKVNVPHSAVEAAPYIEALYKRMQRLGALHRDCVRLVTNDRNVYAASMLVAGDADAMVTGVTRSYTVTLNDVRQVLDPRPGQIPFGVTVILSKGRLIFVADTTVHEMPSAEELADITIQTAGAVRRLGHEPRVALLAFSTFGFPRGERSERIIEAVEILAARKVDFEYDGEMAADVALNRERMALYPFCRLSDVANILIMPAIHSASISTKMLQELGDVTMLGPLLVGLEKAVQIAPLGAKMSEIYNMAVLAAYDINR